MAVAVGAPYRESFGANGKQSALVTGSEAFPEGLSGSKKG
jgi:hypothetical protein